MDNSLELKEEQPKATTTSSAQVPKMSARFTWQSIQIVLNVVNHTLISIASIYMTYVAYSNGNAAISWHVFLCTIGFQLLMAQAILMLYPQNLWSKQYSRQTQRTFHWIFQLFGSSAAVIGIIVEYIGRWQKSKNHFISTHSTIGLIAGICTLITLLGGITTLWSSKLKQYARPIYVKLAHNFSGITVFAIGMTALYFGYDKNFMVKRSNEYTRKLLQLIAISTIILSLIGAIRALIHHIRNAIAK